MNESKLPSSWPQEREAALVALALDQPVAARAAYLQAVCGQDKALRARLEALLAANEQPATVFASQVETLLAAEYLWLNQLERAEVMALRAVELRRTTIGEDHPLTMASVCNLATIHVLQQQLDQARPPSGDGNSLRWRRPTASPQSLDNRHEDLPRLRHRKP